MVEGLEKSQLPGAIEAMLFVTDEPVGALALAQMLEVDVGDVQEALESLKGQLEHDARGIQLQEIAGGWRLYTHPAYHDLVERYVVSWDTRRMSQAALEVLAVIAYGQPMTRAQVSAIRGVNSETAMNTLIERGYIRECGTLDTPGNPALYGTTKSFLERFGLASPKELPDIEEFAPDEATIKLIRERLGAPSLEEDIDERDMPSPEDLARDAQTALFGVVEKIDFDKLVFNTDDE